MNVFQETLDGIWSLGDSCWPDPAVYNELVGNLFKFQTLIESNNVVANAIVTGLAAKNEGVESEKKNVRVE